MGLAKTFLAIGIAVIFTVFIAYGLYVIYEPPENDYSRSDCYTNYSCHNLTNKCMPEKVMKENSTDEYIRPLPVDENCYDEVYNSKEYTECMHAQDECQEAALVSSPRYSYARNCFFILIVIGLAAIIGGVLISVEGVGSGLIGGGVLTILWVLPYTHDYWMNSSKYLKLFVLGIVLVVLIYLGYKKVEQKSKPAMRVRKKKKR